MWYIGVLINVVGSLSINLSTNVLKLSHSQYVAGGGWDPDSLPLPLPHSFAHAFARSLVRSFARSLTRLDALVITQDGDEDGADGADGAAAVSAARRGGNDDDEQEHRGPEAKTTKPQKKKAARNPKAWYNLRLAPNRLWLLVRDPNERITTRCALAPPLPSLSLSSHPPTHPRTRASAHQHRR